MLFEIGQVVEGKVSGITNFGAFIQLPGGKTGLVHISEVSESYVKNINDHLKQSQPVKVKILSIDPNGKISLSIRRVEENKIKSSRPAEIEWTRKSHESLSFEERLAKFLKDSDERMHDIKKSFESKRGNGGYRKSAQY
mgnify:CR=1 FL=1